MAIDGLMSSHQKPIRLLMVISIGLKTLKVIMIAIGHAIESAIMITLPGLFSLLFLVSYKVYGKTGRIFTKRIIGVGIANGEPVEGHL